jgi:hypothetical protein
VTLGVTLSRLAGELLDWSPRLFGRAPGGGLALVGIAWLVPVVGFYFGHRLARAGLQPSPVARAAGLPLAALALVPILAALAGRQGLGDTATSHLMVWAVASAAGVVLAFAAWPALGRILLAYAAVARLPVVAIMWAAIRWSWGTHYDAPPPSFPAMVPHQRWLWTGVVPQLTVWVAWTVILGAVSGVLGWYVASRRTV